MLGGRSGIGVRYGRGGLVGWSGGRGSVARGCLSAKEVLVRVLASGIEWVTEGEM